MKSGLSSKERVLEGDEKFRKTVKAKNAHHVYQIVETSYISAAVVTTVDKDQADQQDQR